MTEKVKLSAKYLFTNNKFYDTIMSPKPPTKPSNLHMLISFQIPKGGRYEN